jgi:hypothetical protein
MDSAWRPDHETQVIDENTAAMSDKLQFVVSLEPGNQPTTN